MKRVILLALVSIIAVVLYSCGPAMYKTQSSGKDNASYIIVVKESRWAYNNISVVVDNTMHPYGKVYKVRAKRKARPVTVEPGRHNIKVMVDGVVLTEEAVFLGLQETKMVVLR